MRDPWGLDEPPAILDVAAMPPAIARLAEMIKNNESFASIDPDTFEDPQPVDLPEVQTLLEQGWEVLDDAPYCALAPAAWPTTHRAWVRDRLPRFLYSENLDYETSVAPWSDSDRAEIRRDYEAFAAAAGLPPPPPDRIWLLRSPVPGMTVEEILDQASDLAATGPDSEDMFFRALTQVLARLRGRVRPFAQADPRRQPPMPIRGDSAGGAS